MVKIIVDTSVFVDHIRADKGALRELLLLQKSKKALLYIPSIVILELWRGLSMDNLNVQKSVERMLLGIRIVDLTKQLARKAGELVRNEMVVDSEDAIIAATALYLDAQLATNNRRHFQKIKNLRFFKN